MSDFGRLVYKLAVIHDIFEIKELAKKLRDATEWDLKDATLGLYLKGERTPPPGFSDQLRRALELDEDTYHLLLYVYDRTTGRLSPHQREQTARFEQMLREEAARRYLGNGGGTTN
jgi:hypothetical protein